MRAGGTPARESRDSLGLWASTPARRRRVRHRPGFLNVLRKSRLTGPAWGSYKPLIDGGAAEAARGFRRFPSSLWRTWPGRVCRVCRRLPWSGALCRVLASFGVVCPLHRCLTIASEERETWTAGSLRSAVADTCREARREDFSDGHVSRFIALRLSGWGGCVWDSSSTSGLLGLDLNCDQSGSKFSSFPTT